MKIFLFSLFKKKTSYLHCLRIMISKDISFWILTLLNLDILDYLGSKQSNISVCTLTFLKLDNFGLP